MSYVKGKKKFGLENEQLDGREVYETFMRNNWFFQTNLQTYSLKDWQTKN